jgi:putative transposase
MIQMAEDLGQQVGVKRACEALGVSRSSLYRARQPDRPPALRPKPARTLSEAERRTVRDVLNRARFADCAPRQVYATLLDERVYLCSWRTMYRILDESQEVRERRNQLTHPAYAKPELLATTPNQLWSWDITKLLGPAKWTDFYL